MSRIFLTDSSKLDIHIIAENLDVFNNIGQSFIEGVFDRMDILEDNPLIGSTLEDKSDIATDYRYLVFKFTKILKYIIIYRFNEDRSIAYINRIFDSREDYMRVIFGADVD